MRRREQQRAGNWREALAKALTIAAEIGAMAEDSVMGAAVSQADAPTTPEVQPRRRRPNRAHDSTPGQ